MRICFQQKACPDDKSSGQAFFLRMSDPVHFLRAMYEAFPLNDAILVISLCGMVEESLGIRLSIVKFLPHRSFAPR